MFMVRMKTTDALIQRVLSDDYLRLRVIHYQVAEYVSPEGGCRVTLTIETGDDEVRETVEGRGVGFVDAVYQGLMQHFAQAFASLKTLQFTGFAVDGRMETGRDSIGLDAEVEVRLGLRNPDDRRFEFLAVDRSTLAAAVAAVVQVVEYFVNSERAYVRLHRALADARGRQRPDLIERFRSELAELVNTTSYVAVSAQVRTL
jgi:hypothetical protein